MQLRPHRVGVRVTQDIGFGEVCDVVGARVSRCIAIACSRLSERLLPSLSLGVPGSHTLAASEKVAYGRI